MAVSLQSGFEANAISLCLYFLCSLLLLLHLHSLCVGSFFLFVSSSRWWWWRRQKQRDRGSLHRICCIYPSAILHSLTCWPSFGCLWNHFTERREKKTKESESESEKEKKKSAIHLKRETAKRDQIKTQAIRQNEESRWEKTRHSYRGDKREREEDRRRERERSKRSKRETWKEITVGDSEMVNKRQTK